MRGMGPIPADAGEPGNHPGWDCRYGAYPRGRGGARSCTALSTISAGLSPRTRGSLDAQDARAVARGPIPADAGEP